MCRDILNSCVRNTEEAEKHSRSLESASGSGSSRGGGKGVWGMIEESELAKTIREGEGKKVGLKIFLTCLLRSEHFDFYQGDVDIVVRARTCISQLENLLSPPSTPNWTLSSPMSTPNAKDPSGETFINNGKTVVLELGRLIQAEAPPERMEELLGLCDRLNLLLARVPSVRPSKLQLQGLGLKVSGSNGNGIGGNGLFANGNGHATLSESPVQGDDDDDVPSPTTPKIDKGKGRAEPEPEEHEPVLSPKHFLVGESEDEDEDGQRFLDAEEGDDSVTSPTDR